MNSWKKSGDWLSNIRLSLLLSSVSHQCPRCLLLLLSCPLFRPPLSSHFWPSSSHFWPSSSLFTRTLLCFDVWPNYVLNWGCCGSHWRQRSESRFVFTRPSLVLFFTRYYTLLYSHAVNYISGDAVRFVSHLKFIGARLFTSPEAKQQLINQMAGFTTFLLHNIFILALLLCFIWRKNRLLHLV